MTPSITPSLDFQRLSISQANQIFTPLTSPALMPTGSAAAMNAIMLASASAALTGNNSSLDALTQLNSATSGAAPPKPPRRDSLPLSFLDGRQAPYQRRESTGTLPNTTCTTSSTGGGGRMKKSASGTPHSSPYLVPIRGSGLDSNTMASKKVSTGATVTAGGSSTPFFSALTSPMLGPKPRINGGGLRASNSPDSVSPHMGSLGMIPKGGVVETSQSLLSPEGRMTEMDSAPHVVESQNAQQSHTKGEGQEGSHVFKAPMNAPRKRRGSSTLNSEITSQNNNAVRPSIMLTPGLTPQLNASAVGSPIMRTAVTTESDTTAGKQSIKANIIGSNNSSILPPPAMKGNMRKRSGSLRAAAALKNLSPALHPSSNIDSATNSKDTIMNPLTPPESINPAQTPLANQTVQLMTGDQTFLSGMNSNFGAAFPSPSQTPPIDPSHTHTQPQPQWSSIPSPASSFMSSTQSTSSTSPIQQLQNSQQTTKTPPMLPTAVTAAMSGVLEPMTPSQIMQIQVSRSGSQSSQKSFTNHMNVDLRDSPNITKESQEPFMDNQNTESMSSLLEDDSLMADVALKFIPTPLALDNKSPDKVAAVEVEDNEDVERDKGRQQRRKSNARNDDMDEDDDDDEDEDEADQDVYGNEDDDDDEEFVPVSANTRRRRSTTLPSTTTSNGRAARKAGAAEPSITKPMTKKPRANSTSTMNPSTVTKKAATSKSNQASPAIHPTIPQSPSLNPSLASVAPALRPQPQLAPAALQAKPLISPSLKPLLPGVSNFDAARRLATKSNYQNMIEGSAE
jgi:hypothetical protein